ncbi:hypothetical protein CCACVL1_09591, partial [Corchorus capsularis]
FSRNGKENRFGHRGLGSNAAKSSQNPRNLSNNIPCCVHVET